MKLITNLFTSKPTIIAISDSALVKNHWIYTTWERGVFTIRTEPNIYREGLIRTVKGRGTVQQMNEVKDQLLAVLPEAVERGPQPQGLAEAFFPQPQEGMDLPRAARQNRLEAAVGGIMGGFDAGR